MRMVLLVLFSVASPSWGPYYTLLAYCGLLAACMLDHGISKPYKDLALQQLQTIAYIVLLVNVLLGIIVVTANTRPGPRSAGSVFGQSVAAATKEHCPEQLFGESNSGKTVAAASFAMVFINVCFVAVACLIVFSLATRGLRNKSFRDQLLQFARDGRYVWVLGLGVSSTSKFGIPFVHAGQWAVEMQAEHSSVSTGQQVAPNHGPYCWIVAGLRVFARRLKQLRTLFCWWPAEEQK
jgi:hypothetical protein